MKISIVIPSHNCVHFLPAAVRSALDQDHPNVEVIVVDDASTDKTAQYLDWLSEKHPQVKIITNPTNRGRSESRNIGNKAATGDIILVLDADDMAASDRATRTVRIFKDTGADYVYGAAIAANALGRHLEEIKAKPISMAEVLKSKFTGIVHSTAAYTKEFSQKYPYRSGEADKLGLDDWTQQIEALRDGAKFEVCPGTLSIYRETRGGIMSRRDPKAVEAYKMKILEQTPLMK